MKYNFYTLLFFLFTTFQAFSQLDPKPSGNQLPLKCGYEPDSAIQAYTKMLINRMYADPTGKNGLRTQASVYKIPVVVHVIEPSTATSLITNAQINNFIANLNTAYRGTGSYAGSPDIEIEFELAKFDPACGATNGITRYDASSNAQYVAKGVFNDGVTWGAIQSWRTWTKSLYMNIWVVNKMDNGAAGVGGPSEGVISLASAISGSHDYVTPHEAGHYLGVAHPFPDDEGGCNCGDGDGLIDTPNLMAFGIASPCSHEIACTPTARNSTNPCTGSPFGEIQINIMNYVSGGCDQKFTNDQKNLMRGMLESYHVSLLTSPVLGASAPTASANLSGDNSFCTASASFPKIVATCICSSISGLTFNGSPVSEALLMAKPILAPGQSVTWNFGLSCANGLSASKSVTYYNPGVTNALATCTSGSNYKVTFDNPGNYMITTSAGTVSGNSIINIPNSSAVVISATDANGCGSSVSIAIPCCAQNYIAAAQCVPTAANGLSNYFGIDNFTFGGINKSSSTSADDGANYIDRACSDVASLSASGNYDISVTGAVTNPHYVKVYIDYDNNGTFSTSAPNELVFSGTTPGSSNNNTLSGNITIPATAVRNVPLRVRVLADYVPSSDACSINGFNTGRVLINYGSGQIEDFSITIQNPLPVNLISFEGKAEKNAVNLTWETTWEEKNAGFEIQRSDNAVNFEAKGFVDGKNAVSQLSKYNFQDLNVNPASTYYYRLKQIDVSGGYEFSRIISVASWYESVTAHVFPNPSGSGKFTLSIPDSKSYVVSMFNTQGIEFSVDAVQTNNPDEVIIKGNFPAGFYLLKTTSKTGLPEKIIHVAIE